MAQLIVALDVDNLSRAKYFINKLYPRIKIFKVGLQLFTAAGPQVIRYIQKKRGEVFLDLKFYDIPNTVANAVRQAAALKVKMLTLHIAGGEEMLRAAVQAAAGTKGRRPLLIGVTVLTSQAAGSGRITALAKKAIAAGLDGVVASGREAASLRRQIGRNFIIVTPGIRPKGASAADQKRVATPEEAAQAGSDFLVAGRPILEAENPSAVAGVMVQALRR